MKTINRRLLTTSLLTMTLGMGGCSRFEDASASSSDADENKPTQRKIVSIQGAGATFPYPLYSKWIAEYNKAHPHVRINYQSIGSGGGIRQIVKQTVDFGATDAPMEEADARGAAGTLLHIPTTIGAVVLAYNLPGITEPLRLGPDVIADIYLGAITNWNDPRISAANEGVQLPDKNIAVVHRSDGSGTTAVFTDYLASVSSDFESRVGVGKAVKWPTGLGAKGNEGVAGQVKTTPGAFGYVELAYAAQNKLPYARVRNRAGKFVEAKIGAMTASGVGRKMPDSLHVSLADPEGADAYPISAYTYILVYEDTKNREKAQAIARFLWWAIHDGQKYSEALHYAPLPEPVVRKVEARLKTLKSAGQLLLADI